MFDKRIIALGLICIVLSVGLAGALILLNQKDAEMQTNANLVSELEMEKLSLQSLISTLQYNMSSIQYELNSLNNENTALESQVASLQASLESETASLRNEKQVLESQVSNLQNELTSLTNEKAALASQVSSLQTEFAALVNEKNALETQISTLQSEISSFQTQIASLEADKTTLEQQASALQASVESLQTQVQSLQSDKTSLETQVADLTSQVADLEAEVISSYYSGYDEGYAQGADDLLQNGYYYIDPTYDEAIAFIDSDTTDENEYTSEYNCYDFTSDFNSNAAQTGYRCGFVYIEFAYSAHAIACFNTTDAGVIFVEPQNDQIVDVALGETYLGMVIVKMGIIW